MQEVSDDSMNTIAWTDDTFILSNAVPLSITIPMWTMIFGQNLAAGSASYASGKGLHRNDLLTRAACIELT